MPRVARYTALFTMISMIVLAGCGQKGPLYLPQESVPQAPASSEAQQDAPSETQN